MKKTQGKVVTFAYPGNAGYWSAAEHNFGGAWFVYFGSGSIGFNGKGGRDVVRPVTAFTYTVQP